MIVPEALNSATRPWAGAAAVASTTTVTVSPTASVICDAMVRCQMSS